MLRSIVGLVLACTLGTPMSALASETRDVLRRAHDLNQVIIEAASLAQRRAVREDVRAYARRLEMDHRFADHQVLELASELDLDITGRSAAAAVPADSEEAKRRQAISQRLDDLKEMSDQEFDLAFLRLMRTAHMHGIRVLSSSQREAPPGLIRLLDRMIPILEQHVELAVHLFGSSGARAEADR